jgi:DNA-3-methyladenine glycosylase
LFLLQGDTGSSTQIVITPRVGVDYAKEWTDAPLRYYDANSRAVSKPR